jgi:hypothetical protein
MGQLFAMAVYRDKEFMKKLEAAQQDTASQAATQQDNPSQAAAQQGTTSHAAAQPGTASQAVANAGPVTPPGHPRTPANDAPPGVRGSTRRRGAASAVQESPCETILRTHARRYRARMAAIPKTPVPTKRRAVAEGGGRSKNRRVASPIRFETQPRQGGGTAAALALRPAGPTTGPAAGKAASADNEPDSDDNAFVPRRLFAGDADAAKAGGKSADDVFDS